MPYQNSRSRPRSRYVGYEPYRAAYAPVAPAGDSRIVLLDRAFDAIIGQQNQMFSLVNTLVQQNSRPNITRVVQAPRRHVYSPPTRQADAVDRPSLHGRFGGLMPPTGPRHRQITTVRGRRHYRNQNWRDKKRERQAAEAAQAQDGEASVANKYNGAGLVESVKNDTYDTAADGDGLPMSVNGGVDEDVLGRDGWAVKGQEDISSGDSTYSTVA